MCGDGQLHYLSKMLGLWILNISAVGHHPCLTRDNLIFKCLKNKDQYPDNDRSSTLHTIGHQ